MTAGIDTSDPAGPGADENDTLEFRTFNYVRLNIALIGLMVVLGALFAANIFFFLYLYPAGDGEITEKVAMIMTASLVVQVLLVLCLLQFVVIRKWVTQTERITWGEAGFESWLHGTVVCDDIRSYWTNTFHGSRTLILRTKNGKIHYRLSQEKHELFVALTERMSHLIDDYNATKVAEHDGSRRIQKSTFLESTGALVLAMFATVVIAVLLSFPLGTANGIYLLVVIAGLTCSLWIGICRARTRASG